jgi:hypothetical protein
VRSPTSRAPSGAGFSDDDLQRHIQRAGEIAVSLCKEHPDWTWDRIASVTRRQTGLRPLQAWERG